MLETFLSRSAEDQTRLRDAHVLYFLVAATVDFARFLFALASGAHEQSQLPQVVDAFHYAYTPTQLVQRELIGGELAHEHPRGQFFQVCPLVLA